MAFHCGAPTRDGSPCQRHVRELGIRCPQHRNLGGTALHPPRHAMRTIDVADPALTAARTAWTSTRADLTARAGELRDRVTPAPEQESPDAPAGTHPTEDDGARATEPATEPGRIGTRSYLDRERSRRVRAEADDEQEAAGEAQAGHAEGATGAEPEHEAEHKAEHEAEHERRDAEPKPEPEPEAERPSALLSYLDRERARRLKAEAAAEPERDAAAPLSALAYIARQRAGESEPDSAEPDQPAELDQPSVSDQQLPAPDQSSAPDQPSEPEPRPVEQRPQLRRERALDPDWITARPLFRDEAPTRPLPKIEFEPSEGRPPRKPPRVPPMRSVVLNPAPDSSQPTVTPNGFAAEPDPPTLIDRMPPIDHDDLVVPEFLRPDFGAPAAAPEPRQSRPPLPKRTPRPWPIPKSQRKPKADPDHPTLIDPHPPIAAAAAAPTTASTAAPVTPATPVVPAAAPVATAKPAAPLARAAATARPATTAKPAATPVATTVPAAPAAAATPSARATAAGRTAAAADPAAPDDIAVPDFIVPGFTQPVKPPLRTVLSTVLGPDLWQRCYVEWSPAHCTALARIARTVDGLAPSAGTAVRSTAGAGMRWLGVAREREMLADEVAAAISHPVGATASNQARTVRLYGAAICMALNIPLRRCACHRDLDRDVSGELIRLGLEELAGEVT
jgi:hypothetical protein